MTDDGRPRHRIDWDAIGRDYHTGALSLREMARKHDCSHSAIANFAGRHGWVRVRSLDGTEDRGRRAFDGRTASSPMTP